MMFHAAISSNQGGFDLRDDQDDHHLHGDQGDHHPHGDQGDLHPQCITDKVIMTDMSNMLTTILQIEAEQQTPTTGESLLSHIVSQYATT